MTFRKIGAGTVVALAGVAVLVRFLLCGDDDSDGTAFDGAAALHVSASGNRAATGTLSFPAGSVNGEVILFFETESARENFLANLKKNARSVLGVIPGINAVRVSESVLAGLPEPAGMVHAGFNFPVRVPAINPEDSFPPELREKGFGGNVPVGGNALSLMHATEEACGASPAGSGVKIAVLDTGIFTEHAVFSGVRISQIDIAGGVADTPDSQAHGTAVASLIFGNGEGAVSGLASQAELLAVRVFDGAGNATAFSIAQGIVAAVDAGANLINISAGITEDSAVLRAAVEYAQAAGTALVASAGNEGVTALAFPAAYPGVISVGAVDGAGSSAPFSNVGENLSVAAPGVGVYAAGTDTRESIVDFSGTSASAPLVTGALAAAISNSTGSFDAQKISETADDFGTPGRDSEYGSGIVNFERLMRPVGASITDVSVNDFYLSGGKGGSTEAALGVTMQNRGTLWEACSFSLRITFSDGSVSVTSGNLNLQPGESFGRETSFPASNLTDGVLVDAEIRDASGKLLSEKSAVLRKQ